MATSYLSFKTSEGDLTNVSINIANEWKTIKVMLDMKIENEYEVIPLQNIDSKTLNIIVDWTKHYLDKRLLVENVVRDKKFVAEKSQQLYRLILAADYLDMKGLLDVLDMILRGRNGECKSLDQVRSIYRFDHQTNMLVRFKDEVHDFKHESRYKLSDN